MSKKIDKETNKTDIDPIEKLLEWGLKNSPQTSGEPPHLDDETMAAYLDKMLSEEERAGAEEHMADCGDCLHEIAALYNLSKEIEKDESNEKSWTEQLNESNPSSSRTK